MNLRRQVPFVRAHRNRLEVFQVHMQAVHVRRYPEVDSTESLQIAAESPSNTYLMRF